MIMNRLLTASPLLLVLASPAAAAPLTVDLEGVRTGNGTLYVSVQTREQFMQQDGTAGTVLYRPQAGAHRFAFEVPAGDYAVSVWHDVLERPSLRHVEVFCERAYFSLEHDWWGPVSWTRPGGDEARLEGDALVAELDRRSLPRADADGGFIGAVREGRPAWPTFADALRAHQLTDAVYRSAAAGGAPVDVSLAPAP